MGQSFERERDRRGFKELAKLAGSPSQPKAGSVSGIRRTKDENDSGMVDLHVLAAADPGAVDRASVTPLASEPLGFGDDDADETNRLPAVTPVPAHVSSASKRPSTIAPPPLRAASVPPPFPSAPASRPAPSVPAPALSRGPLSSPTELRPIVAGSVASAAGVSHAPVVSAQSLAAKPAPRRSPMVSVAALAGLAALAAGAFFVVRSVRASHAATNETVVVSAPAHAGELAAATQGANQAPAPTPAANPGVDPMSLPRESAAVASNHHGARTWHANTKQSLVAKADAKESADDAPAPKQPEPVAAKEAPAPAPAPPANNTLLASMKNAADSAPAAPSDGPSAPVTAAAATGATGVAPRPSQGQVTGALGAVLPEARLCLNEDDGVSRAHIVFASDGSVQSVSVAGFASGKPAEGCIKTALGKAHVPPFAEASYGATVTVRP